MDDPDQARRAKQTETAKLRLAQTRIVLVEPAGPLNLGAVARVMKNMGLQQLFLVNPQCDPRGLEAQRMAVHAQDILAAAISVATLPEALIDCQSVVATTLVRRHLQIDPQPPRQILPCLLDQPSALVFGPEDRGLSNEQLYYAQQFLQIPTSPVYAALNLAQAVTICCYELRQLALTQKQVKAQDLRQAPEGGTAPLQEMENFYQALEDLLLDIGYLYPHTTKARMQKLRQLFNRSHLSSQELAMLRGMIRQIDWKIQGN
ncbi:MAG: RNA methyltransferase [Acaryochloridaceae cyanobacterium CSU_5_19]|nr:RNA methyltransferase [Acaryochloridaceae cyanobacterium CSU_5_19]